MGRAFAHLRLMLHTGFMSLVTTVVDYALYIGLVELCGLHYVAAAIVSGTFGLVLNFILNRVWVFPGAVRSIPAQFLRYAAMTGVGIGCVASLLYALVELGRIPYWLGLGIANLIVFAAWTYPTNRLVVFPSPGSSWRSS